MDNQTTAAYRIMKSFVHPVAMQLISVALGIAGNDKLEQGAYRLLGWRESS